MSKKPIAILLSVLFLLCLVSCGPSEEDKLYDELTAKNSTASSEAASSTPESRKVEESEVSQAESEEEVPEDPDRYVQKLEWNQLFDIEPNTELSGTLTIAVDSSLTLEPWIKAFQAVYPNVKISTKLYPITSEDSSKALVVDLYSGATGDLIYLNTLSVFRYGESGLFQDLYSYMDADPDLQREDFYTAILSAMETRDGKLCAITPTVSIMSAYFNAELTDKLNLDVRRDYPDGMTARDITDLYQKCVKEGILEPDAPLSPVGSKMYLFQDTLMSYFDEQQQEADFENPGFIEHLETMNQIPTYKMLAADGWATDYVFQSPSEFMVLGADTFTILPHYWEVEEKYNSTVWVPLKTENNRKPFQARLPMGITSSCQNPELAWEFLKFMLSDKPFPPKPAKGYTDIAYANLYNGNIPINRTTFENLFYSYYDNDELFAFLDNLYSQRDMVRFKDGQLLLAWKDILTSYWENGLISAEECAKQLQERTWIYMNE